MENYNLYVNKNIPQDYIFCVPSESGNFYDLYNTTIIEPQQNYNFYRVWTYIDEDFIEHINSFNNTQEDIYITGVTIEQQNNYIYRNDYPEILFCSTFLILFFVILFNIGTSIIRKNGLLSGLF